MNIFTVFLFVMVLVVAGAVSTCSDAQNAPTIQTPADSADKVDTVPPCLPPDCWPDPRPPGVPARDSPFPAKGGLIAIVEPLEL